MNFTELLEAWCPLMMSIGMTFEQFWHEDPHLVMYYYRAEEYRQKQRNEEAWRLGAYVYFAIGSFVEILPAFPKKGAKIQPYLEEPFAVTRLEQEEREERKRQKRIAELKERMMKFVRKGGENNVTGDSNR